MEKLSQSTVEALKHYVYLLIDPRNGKPFYVGKGCGNRINHHLLDALKTHKNEKEKIKRIHDIQAAGLEVGLAILRHGLLTGEEAFEVESAMIDFIGKESLTNIVLGHHADDRGLLDLEGIKIKYEAEEAVFDEPAILININNQYRHGMSIEEFYEATRKHWVVDRHRANRIRIVCSVYRGIIREVFIAHQWLPSPDDRRSYFEGELAPESIRNKYRNKSVTKYWKQGSQWPTKYVG